MVLSEWEFRYAPTTDIQMVKELLIQRKDAANFINQCIFDRAIQESLGFRSLEWEFNSYVLHNPVSA